MSAAVVVAFCFLLAMGGLGYRADDMIPVLGWFARFAERISGQPAWASLPCGLAIASLITAVFGLYWDVSMHIDVGRDIGPLNNTAHYFILGGLFGIVASGFYAICLPDEDRTDRPGPTAIRIAEGWYAPLGGVLMFVAGSFSLIAFPLDDIWHRLFGQDVTLWGPTHLMLIGGAALTLVGIAVIQMEVVRAMKGAGVAHLERTWVKGLRNIALPGGLLTGMSTVQGEFDFGVPQFQLVFHPMLIMLAAGVVLVATRVWLGRGTAIGAVAFFLAMRGGLTYLVGPVLGESTTHFPLFIAEAAVVELTALAVSVRRPLAFAAWSGLGIGTIGLAAEWAWSHVWMPIPWPAELLPEGVVLGLAMALAGALIGGWVGARLGSEQIPYDGRLRVGAVAASAAVAAMIGIGLYSPADGGVSGTVTLREVDGAPKRSAIATVALRPADAARDAKWLTATAWQGGGLVVDRLDQIRPGVYRSTKPIPLYGDWKTLIRLHSGTSITGLPIYAPADAAIPARAVPAPASFTRPFFADKELLRREAKTTDPAVTVAAYGTVIALALAMFALLAWAIHRIGVTAGESDIQPPSVSQQPPPPEPVEPPPVPVATLSAIRGP